MADISVPFPSRVWLERSSSKEERSRLRGGKKRWATQYQSLNVVINIMVLGVVVCLVVAVSRLTRSEHSRAVAALINAMPTEAFCNKTRAPLVCAHAGDTLHAPPNTARALRAALALGADCIEVDVSMTLDGVLVAMNARSLAALLEANGEQGTQVAYLAWPHLQRLAWPSGDAVLSVEAAMQLVMPFTEQVILDIKLDEGGRQAQLPGGGQDEKALKQRQFQITDKLLDLVHALGCTKCLVWANRDDVVQRLRELSPTTAAGYVVMRNGSQEHEIADRMPQANVAAVHHEMLSQELILQLRDRAKQLHAWTVDSPEALRRVLDAGVDGIVTNQAALAIDAIEARLAKCGRSGSRFPFWSRQPVAAVV